MAKKPKPPISPETEAALADLASAAAGVRLSRGKIQEIVMVPGFSCPQYSIVPRLIVFVRDGRIFELKIGEEAVWKDISIYSASVGSSK